MNNVNISRCRKIYHAPSKEIGGSCINFRQGTLQNKEIIRNKEWYYILIKGTIIQETEQSLTRMHPTTVLKYKTKTDRTVRRNTQIDYYSWILPLLPLSVVDISCRQKI